LVSCPEAVYPNVFPTFILWFIGFVDCCHQVGDEEDSPALSAAASADGFYKLLVDALNASLNGTDYPVGSNLFYRNWKVRISITEMYFLLVHFYFYFATLFGFH
jgi:hypothetical protein